MKHSLGREPRWNADRCAPHAFEARPCPSARQILHCVCRRFASEAFLFFFFRHPCQAALANASTGIFALPLGTEHRSKSRGDGEKTRLGTGRALGWVARTER